MNDSDAPGDEQPSPMFFDFPEAVPGRPVQVLLLDGTWVLGRVVSVSEKTDEPNTLDWLVMTNVDTGRNTSPLPGDLIGSVMIAN